MAEQQQEIQFADLERLAKADAPDLAAAIIAFAQQPDPTPEPPLAAGAIGVAALQQQLATASYKWTAKAERKRLKYEAWKNFLAQPDARAVPSRFRLAELLVAMYDSGSDAARATLVEVVRTAPWSFGVWGGIKRIFKLAEVRHDARVFGAIAATADTRYYRGSGGNVSPATLLYVRRRAWRYLRELGAAVPEIYPQFAAEVLRNYDATERFASTWVANHIVLHGSKNYDSRSFAAIRDNADFAKHRAFGDAWKRSADPLMYLLETCEADMPARFAIQGLRKDFPDALRNVTPAWLERLARRPLVSVHEFLIETLQGSPEFHQGRLKGLGLHETVLSLLYSPSAKARAYAIEYTRGQAGDLEAARLVELVEKGPAEDVKQMAAAMLQARPPRDVGIALLGRLLATRATSAWATKALNESFDRKEITEEVLIDFVFAGGAQRQFATTYLTSRYQPGEIGPRFWMRVIDDPRAVQAGDVVNLGAAMLARFAVADIPVAWLIDALTRQWLGPAVAQWLKKAEALPGLDVERIKGLVFNPAYRAVALEILLNGKLVKPRDIGLAWLLALARRADPSLHQFAHRYLLEHMKPEDFAEGSDDKNAGIARLFALATGEKEPEPVRLFAQTYLRAHHPEIGPEQPEAKAIGLKPRMPRAAYSAERIWPFIEDRRPDVRKFAVAIARAELRAWKYQARVYELAESEHKEVRNIAYDALLKIGHAGHDDALVLKVDELDAARVFALTESKRRTTRDVGVELIRRHYARLGGAERLGWLMQSADREVRLFAVRLLWEKHRPRHLPADWKPRGKGTNALEPTEPFADVEALRDFLRRTLFGVPPGRSMEARDEAEVKRRMPASAAKRNVIDVVRDLGLEDPAFARLVAPVLSEFTGSIAKGEWQACLAALVQLRGAHPGVELGGAI